MHIPTENETRAFFERMGNFLAPIDRSRGPKALILYAGKPTKRCSAHSSYPTLQNLWQTWAEHAIYVRQRQSRIEAVVLSWQIGNGKTRRIIERWLDNCGESSWSRRYYTIKKALPSSQMSSANMPRGWREQLLRDLVVEGEESGMTFHERIRTKIDREKSDQD